MTELNHGIVIIYDYDGDEDEWRAACETFVAAINTDQRLRGRLTYQVNRAAEGPRRVHIGRWDGPETVAHLQQQDFFKTFAGAIGRFSGGGPDATRIDKVFGTIGT